MLLPLTRGLATIIDDDVAEMVLRHKWHAVPCFRRNGKFYARAGFQRKNLYLHRFITDCPTGKDVDHINHDTLDNRLSNLRICTRSQNNAAASKRQRLSGFRGVHKSYSKWYAECQHNGIYRRSSGQTTAVAAALIYDEWAKELHGEFASLNFPENT